jgi:hypothetical protein
MDTSAEKLVKQTIKLISKLHDISYEQLKHDARKLIKSSRNYDESILGVMEELMDLGNVGSIEELTEFNIDVLKVYCRIKDIDNSGSDKSIISKVWKNIEEEFELNSEEEISESEDDSDSEDEEEPIQKLTPVQELVPEPVTKPSKKSKKEVVIIG